MGLQLGGIFWVLSALGSAALALLGTLVSAALGARGAAEGRGARVRTAITGPLAALALECVLLAPVRWVSRDTRAWLDALWLVPPIALLALLVLVRWTRGRRR